MSYYLREGELAYLLIFPFLKLQNMREIDYHKEELTTNFLSLFSNIFFRIKLVN